MSEQTKDKCQGSYKGMDFKVMAQAIVKTARAHEIVGYELTVRPLDGSPASELIGLATDNYEKVDLDIVIVRAIQNLEHPVLANNPMNLWINLFPSTLASSSAMGVICNSIRRSHHNIVIEITENEFITDYQTMYDSVVCLQEAGAEVVMDDFGAGAASLRTLLELPLDGIKLDLKVFQMAVADNRYLPLLEGLARTAKNLDIPVVAEGVETAQHLVSAQALGVELAQGYYIDMPKPFLSMLDALAVPESGHGRLRSSKSRPGWEVPANDALSDYIRAHFGKHP